MQRDQRKTQYKLNWAHYLFLLWQTNRQDLVIIDITIIYFLMVSIESLDIISIFSR